MNFKKLQVMQAKLDEAILAKKTTMTTEERFHKTLVALSVEIAEVANTAEHFKFWKDNKGKVDGKRFNVTPSITNGLAPSNCDFWDVKEYAFMTKEQAHRLTLVEECSDALHFILSLANQLSVEIELDFRWHDNDISREENYLSIQHWIVIAFNEDQRDSILVKSILVDCLNYFEVLGITEKELEQAYYDKNKINYERLENGY